MTQKPKRDRSPAIQSKGQATEIREQSTEVSFFKGPIPSPEILEYYRKLVPDAPERILRLAEGEAQHRRGIETRKLELAGAQIRRGQWFGLVFGLAALTVVGVSVYFNAPWVAGVLGSGTIIAVVTAFVLGRRREPARTEKSLRTTQPAE